MEEFLTATNNSSTLRMINSMYIGPMKASKYEASLQYVTLTLVVELYCKNM